MGKNHPVIQAVTVNGSIKNGYLRRAKLIMLVQYG